MTVASGIGELYRGITSLWDSQQLDTVFTAYWTAAEIAANPVLNDQEAAPGQPWPYCVLEEPGFPEVISRMSSKTSGTKRIEKDYPINFNIHARPEEGRDGKSMAAYLADKVKAVFGGHPEDGPESLSLRGINHLQTQLVSESIIRTGDEEYQYILRYVFKTDEPETV